MRAVSKHREIIRIFWDNIGLIGLVLSDFGSILAMFWRVLDTCAPLSFPDPSLGHWAEFFLSRPRNLLIGIRSPGSLPQQATLGDNLWVLGAQYMPEGKRSFLLRETSGSCDQKPVRGPRPWVLPQLSLQRPTTWLLPQLSSQRPTTWVSAEQLLPGAHYTYHNKPH